MSKTNKHYSLEFKEQIINLYNSGHSVSSLVSEYSLKRPTIYKWINDLKAIEITADGITYTKKDIDLRDKRIRELELENEILKKATAIFARKP